MPTPSRVFTVDIGAPGADGLYVGPTDSPRQVTKPRFIARNTELFGHRFAQDLNPSDALRLTELATTGLSLDVTIGPQDLAPRDGDMVLAINAHNTDPIAFDATASDFFDAVNVADSVSVTKQDQDYIVTANSLNVAIPVTLVRNSFIPASYIDIEEMQVQSATQRNVWRVRVTQKGYAFGSPSTAFPTLSSPVTASSEQTGTSLVPSIQKVTFSPIPYGGTGIWQYSDAEITSIFCLASRGPNQEFTTVETIADVAGSLAGKYFDVNDFSGPVRVWFKVSGVGSAPPTPFGGRLLEVDFSTNATAIAVATAVASYVTADSEFTASSVNQVVTISTDDNIAVESPSAGDSGFTITRSIEGSYGDLYRSYFVLYDDVGSVGVHFAVSGAPLVVPAGAAECSRTKTVFFTTADSAGDIADAVATVLDGDAAFVATASGQTVTVTCATVGTRTAPDAGDSGFTLTVTRPGVSISTPLAWTTDTALIAAALGNAFTVINPEPGVFRLTAVGNGVRSAATVVTTNLLVPRGFIGSLEFDTVAMSYAWGGTDQNEITTKYAWRLTESGASRVVLLIDCELVKDNHA